MNSIVVMTKADFDDIIRDAASQAAALVIGNMKRAPEYELWDAEQVGQYLGVSALTIKDSWSHRKKFPAAIVLGEGSKAPRRWVADEIRDYVTSLQRAA